MNEAQKLINEHQFVNIDNYIYVVDGVCVIIEPDSLDFTDVRQLQDLFQYVAVFKTNSFLNERRGKNNTYIHISGYVSELEKAVGFGDMRNIPVDKLKIVRAHFAMNCTPNLMNGHQFINIDNYIHVIDGICVCFEPNTINFTDAQQVNDLFTFIESFKSDAFFYARCGKNNTCVILTGNASESYKDVSCGYLDDLPKDKLEIVRGYNLWIFR